jgi:hypothetical protein
MRVISLILPGVRSHASYATQRQRDAWLNTTVAGSMSRNNGNLSSEFICLNTVSELQHPMTTL